MQPTSRIRYAVIGLGYISQVAVLPAFANAKSNSELAAIVSDDPVKLKRLGKKYGVRGTYSYEQYEECLRSCSFGAADFNSYRIVGTKGDLRVEPAYEFSSGLKHYLTISGKTHTSMFGKRDQFAPQLIYFSNCILQNSDPEPSGTEGLADVRVIRALYRSAQSGHPEKLDEFMHKTSPGMTQEIKRPAVREPELVHASSPSKS